MTLAQQVLARNGIRVAIENHKDWRIDEMPRTIERIDSEAVGVTIDTGNNMSLLEDPLETVRAFAPFANAVHPKDMGLESYADGFLLAEVPLGEAPLNLKAIVDTIRAARREVRFTLEMITRDPLEIPCLGEHHWVTMKDMPGSDLARSLAAVRDHGRSLPRPEQRPAEERLRFEEENILSCPQLAQAHVDLRRQFLRAPSLGMGRVQLAACPAQDLEIDSHLVPGRETLQAAQRS